jgi:hypothetical protein
MPCVAAKIGATPLLPRGSTSPLPFYNKLKRGTANLKGPLQQEAFLLNAVLNVEVRDTTEGK